MSNKEDTASSAANTLAANNKMIQGDYTMKVGLTQFERIKAIIGAHKNGHITKEQANSLIEDRCPGFFNWRVE